VIDNIGKGGFSLVYLAEDEETGDEVVIKEFMPKKLARRRDDGRLEPVDRRQREALFRSRRLFFQEAKVMASLQHPHIVAVLNMVIRNDTGYIVMQHERGRNLGQFVHERGRSEHDAADAHLPAATRRLAQCTGAPCCTSTSSPATSTYATVTTRCYWTSARPRSDHRRQHGEQCDYRGYSPPEQYRNGGAIGPWTDVYAVGASLRCCIEGRSPQPAPDRLANDTVVPASEMFREQYPDWLLMLIDSAMAMDPREASRRRGGDARRHAGAGRSAGRVVLGFVRVDLVC
jgi:serine/threonine protein kinase